MSLAETLPAGMTAPPSAARALARWCLALEAADLPAAAVAEVKLCLVDLFACALTGGDLPWARQAAGFVESLGAREEATVFGTALRSAAGEAAFANATAAHGLIREDMHVASASHIGVVVLPAMLALAEREGAGGTDFACAVVAGYEAMARLGRALWSERFGAHFRPTGTLGPLAVAAAASRLLRLDEDVAVNALGYAGNMGCGLNQWPWSGGSEIYTHAGVAARAGLLAVDLARRGGTASEGILDGRAGLFAAHGAPDGAAQGFVDGLGGGLQILEVRHKPAPACNFVQTPAQVAEALVATHGVRPEQVAGIEVRSFPAAIAYPGCDHAGPFETVQQAKMSLQFAVASVLAHGRLSEAGFRRLAEPETLRLAGLTRLCTDDAFAAGFPARQGCEVVLRLRDGRRLAARRDDVAWLDEAAVRRRFREEAGALLPPGRAAALEAAIDGLPATSPREIARLLARR